MTEATDETGVTYEALVDWYRRRYGEDVLARAIAETTLAGIQAENQDLRHSLAAAQAKGERKETADDIPG